MYSARKAMEKLRTEVLDRAAGKFCLANCGAMLSLDYLLGISREEGNIRVVVKIMVPFWVPYI